MVWSSGMDFFSWSLDTKCTKEPVSLYTLVVSVPNLGQHGIICSNFVGMHIQYSAWSICTYWMHWFFVFFCLSRLVSLLSGFIGELQSWSFWRWGRARELPDYVAWCPPLQEAGIGVLECYMYLNLMLLYLCGVIFYWSLFLDAVVLLNVLTKME